MTNILVLGASGLAGRKIFNVLNQEYNVFGTFYSKKENYQSIKNMLFMDVDDTNSINHILEEAKPQIVITCLRGDFTKQLEIHRIAAEYIKGVNHGKLIFLSTANVFDKLQKEPHYENDKLESESEYGQFKISCEQLLTEILSDKLAIIRIPFIWSRECPRYKAIINDIENGNPVKVWSNIYTNHTTDELISRYIKLIIEKDMKGIFHVGSADTCDYIDFIKMLICNMNIDMSEFEIDKVPEKSYLAVLSSRDDIPDKLRITNSDIIEYLTK